MNTMRPGAHRSRRTRRRPRGGDTGRRAPGRARWTVGRLLAGGYLLAVTALIALGLSGYARIGTMLRERAPVEHTYAVLSCLSDVRTGLQDAERGQRGFVITGRDSYLQPYERAVTRIERDLGELRRLTADNAR
jgi:CHASE3 domain sensor protein